MSFAPLSTVKHRIHLGSPLPFNVRDSDHTLLLARGHVIESHAQLEALFERGALVDIAELQSPRDEVRLAPREQLPKLWQRCLNDVSQRLLQTPDASYAATLDEAAQPVQALIERDPDLAIFQVLQQGAGDDVAYGARRSTQSAVTAFLVAQRLGWTTDQTERAFKTALTMNLAMLGLQGQLARQATPPSAAQRAALQSHPLRSMQMLEMAGIRDRDWLDAVLQHHEVEDGSGYPSGRSDVSELASLVRRADVYTSKLAMRSTRQALAADIAGRQMFMQDPGHPMIAALVKEFGIYPPGCFVRLASGELAMVVARGPSITTPEVVCLTDERGITRSEPLRRGTVDRRHAVAGVAGLAGAGMPLTPQRLAQVLAS